MSDVAIIADQLADERVEVRATAAERLCQMGDAANGAAAALVKATGDQQPVSTWAVAALEEMGPPPVEAITELVELTGSGQELVAYWAITLLGRLGPRAACAQNALVDVLRQSPHMAARQRSAWALGQLGSLSPSIIDSLRQACREPDPRLARLAARALAACAGQAAEAGTVDS